MKYSFIQLASQVARIGLKMQDTKVGSLGQEDPWRRKQQPTPEFSPRNYSDREAWGCKELDMTERLSTNTACHVGC